MKHEEKIPSISTYHTLHYSPFWCIVLDIPDHIKVKILPLITPKHFINECSSTYRQRKMEKHKLSKKEKRAVRRFGLATFEEVFDLRYNPPGKFTPAQMKSIYERLRSPNTEKRFLRQLEKAGVGGFTRNMPLFSQYFPDFAWPKEKIAVEVDGKFHLLPDRVKRDEAKDRFFLSKGWTVLRYTDPSSHSTLRLFIEDLRAVLKSARRRLYGCIVSIE